MDIVRAPQKKTKRNLLIGGGVLAVVGVTAWTMTLDPASQSIERSAVLIDSVRKGDVVREVRGPGTLVPEQIRWITAQASARVERRGAATKATWCRRDDHPRRLGQG